ncbi:g12600 [Coccomyxa viridis]|uniref:Glycosyltransferase n=1 Tax=Coccomyxa viridis TaxID=1274662 RepID=A0ABP1GEV8_9CHLO
MKGAEWQLPSFFQARQDASHDSQGKNKQTDARSRSQLLVLVFFGMMATGFLTAQYLYIWAQQPDGAADLSTPAAAQKVAMLDKQKASSQPQAKAKSSGALHDLLTQVAPQKEGRPKEVMIAISNYNLWPLRALPLWVKSVKQAKVSNYLVVAIDTALRDQLEKEGIPVYYRDVKVDKAQEGTGDNHAISALKFKIIQEFLELGWNVLLSDVDVVVVQDPFDHLYRDHDVEGMSDGFDDATAYGHGNGIDDQSMGWSRYAQGTTHLNLNSGFFYLQANERTISLMERIAARLAKEKAWDQSVYNEEMFFLSHGSYSSAQVTVRAMDIMVFMNSKVLFRTVRYLPPAKQRKPAVVHINYHPDKLERAQAAYKYFVEGDRGALKDFPGGSEPGS